MVINFKQISYLESVKQNNILKNDDEIFLYAQQTLKFKYVDVTYPKFKANYEEEGWLGRKVIALPAAIWFGIIKTIFHLTKLIFTGIQALYSGDKKNLKTQCFRTIRNFQQSFGHLVSLFDDKYGQYHIQESKFHQSCYDCFEIDLDKEIEKTKKLGNYSQEKDLRFAQLAQVYFNQNNLEKANTLIQACWDYPKRKVFLLKLANTYYERGNLREASLTIKEVLEYAQATEEEGNLIRKVVNGYLDKGELEQAFKRIQEFRSNIAASEADFFLEKIIAEYYKRDDLENALLVTKSFSVLASQTHALSVELIANAYFRRNDLEKTLEMMGKFDLESAFKKNLNMKVADAYYKRGNLKEACEVLKESIGYVQATDEERFLIVKIINSYFDKGDLDQAFYTAKVFYVNIRITALIVKIAKKHYEQDNLKKVFLTISGYSDHDNEEVLDFLDQLVKDFSDKEMLQKLFDEMEKVDFFFLIKERFVSSIIAAYLEKGALKKSLNIIESFKGFLYRDDFREKIINEYLKRGELEDAFSVVKKIEGPFTRNHCILNIAKAFLEIGNKRRAEEVMSACEDNWMKDQFSKLKSEAGPKQSESSKKTEYESFRSKSISGASDDYTILGLKSGASEKEIEKAFRNIAFVKHPDKIKQEENESDEEFIARQEKMIDDYRKALNARDRLLSSKE